MAHKICILTFGDGINTKPSSAALSRNLCVPPEKESRLVMAKDDVETDPLESGDSVTLFTLTGGGIGGGTVLLFSVTFLTTCRWNPAS